MGRPTKYSDEITSKVCEAIANGKALSRVCEDSELPGMSTLFTWLTKYPKFQEKYEAAVDERAERMADETLHIADEKEGEVKRDRLRVDTRKWYLSKMKPKKYGDYLRHGGDKDNPITVSIGKDESDF